MSYSCTISFKKIKSDDVFNFLSEFKKANTAQLSEIAKENYFYCPFIRNDFFDAPRDIKDIPYEEMKQAYSWARDVFSFRYFYDVENQLLGVYGVPTAVEKLFDGSVYFQNSCDQNYEKSEYGGIQTFEDIFEKWMKAPNSVIYDKYKKENLSDFFEEYTTAEEQNKMLDYYRKSFCYDEIWDKYKRTLFDDESAVYLSLYGGLYDILELKTFVVQCHKHYMEKVKEYENKESIEENKQKEKDEEQCM